MMPEAVGRLWRRILMMASRGRVALTDDSGPVQRLQVRLGQDEIRDGTPRLAEYGFTSNVPPETDVLSIFLTGERSRGIVVATNHQSSRLKSLAVGEVAIYDDQGQKVHITRAGITISGAGLPVTITDTPQITLDSPLVYATGDMKVKNDIYDRDGTKNTLQHIRDYYDTHTHGGVQTGSGSTGAPSNSL